MTETRQVGLIEKPAVRVAGLVYVVIAVGHLCAVLAGAEWLTRPTQWLLMPVLAAALMAATTHPRRRLVLLALAFSWLGDTVPSALTGDAAYLSMVGLFLCAQVTYIVAFWPDRDESVARRPAVLGYLAAFVALLVLCGPGTGSLFIPVCVYGVCLTLMAVLASGVHRLTWIGGTVFFVSDSLIGLGRFADWYTPPVPSFWIMVTYVVAQPLIVAGVVRRAQRR